MSKTILFVDDDPDDRDFMAEMIKELKPAVTAIFAENGLKAIEYLSNGKKEANLPGLIVLDLNMPYLDGRETYKKIKDELHLDNVPVIIFTSSSNPNDRTLFASLGVAFYTKPSDFKYYNNIVNQMVTMCSSCN